MIPGTCPSSVRTLAILGIVIGTTLIMTALGTFMGAFSQIPKDAESVFLLRASVARYLIFGVLSIVLAIGLFEGKRWAWFGVLILCLVAFLKFPVGTVIGILVAIFLFRSSVRTFFRIGVSPPPSASP